MLCPLRLLSSTLICKRYFSFSSDAAINTNSSSERMLSILLPSIINHNRSPHPLRIFSLYKLNKSCKMNPFSYSHFSLLVYSLNNAFPIKRFIPESDYGLLSAVSNEYRILPPLEWKNSEHRQPFFSLRTKDLFFYCLIFINWRVDIYAYVYR